MATVGASIPHPGWIPAVHESPASRSRYAALYRVAAFGAILTALLVPLQVVAFIAWPLPEGGAADWFALLRADPVRGLVSYDILILLEEALVVPIVLALYTLLHRRSPSLMLIAAGFWFVSIALLKLEGRLVHA